MTWCEETRRIHVWNLANGIDTFSLERETGSTPTWVNRLPIPIQRNYPVQIAVTSDGDIISGSDAGQVYVWSGDVRGEGDNNAPVQEMDHDLQGTVFKNLLQHVDQSPSQNPFSSKLLQ
jgi:hypothetical protein